MSINGHPTFTMKGHRLTATRSFIYRHATQNLGGRGPWGVAHRIIWKRGSEWLWLATGERRRPGRGEGLRFPLPLKQRCLWASRSTQLKYEGHGRRPFENSGGAESRDIHRDPITRTRPIPLNLDWGPDGEGRLLKAAGIC